jgi:hypothetical protein
MLFAAVIAPAKPNEWGIRFPLYPRGSFGFLFFTVVVFPTNRNSVKPVKPRSARLKTLSLFYDEIQEIQIHSELARNEILTFFCSVFRIKGNVLLAISRFFGKSISFN